jgi:hypothetical protein
MVNMVLLFLIKGDSGVIPTNLDECNGHTDNTYSYYHYHVTPNLTYPYLTNCLKGCIDPTSAGVINFLIN